MAIHRTWVLILTLAAITCSTKATSVFDGFELIAVTPQTKDHMTFLHKMELAYEELDFWQPPILNGSCAILVPQNLLAQFKDLMDEQNIAWRVANSNIATLIEASYGSDQIVGQSQSMRAGDDFHMGYHDYDQIIAYLNSLAGQYPNNLQLSTLNYLTHEGRSVMLVKLHGTNTASGKPSIIVEGGIHAREWVSPAANLYVIDKLLQGYHSGSTTAQQMLDKYDWYFVPVSNPDGYAYSHSGSKNRLWRKNRRVIASRCVGVDLNRNFDIRHGTTGVSFSCSSDIYPGEKAFSEPETANMRNLFYDLQDTVISYLSVHSYSQFVLVPWGFSETKERPSNAVELDRVAMLMSEGIRSVHGEEYHVGTAWQLLEYAASGAAEDWALSVKSDIYAFCYELRPDYYSNVGFLLPPSQIVPTGEEYLASLEVLAENMKV